MNTTRSLTLNALLLATLCVASYINIPIPIIAGAITGTTMAMCLIALVCPPKDTFFIILTYLIMGAIGLPVFAGGGGIAKFMGPAVGYYLSWPLAFPLLSYVTKRYENVWIKLGLALLITIPIIYGMGAVGLILTIKTSVTLAFLGQGVYIPGDVIKYSIASLAASRIQRYFSRD